MSLVCTPKAVGVLDLIFFWSLCTAFQNDHADVNSSECVPGLSSLHLFTYYPSSLGIAILTGARSHLSVASLCVPRWLRMVNTFAHTCWSSVAFFWGRSVQTHYLLKAGSLWFCYWAAPCAFGAISNSKHTLQSSGCLSPCGSLSWLCGRDLLCCDPIYLFLFLFPVFGSHMKTLIPPTLSRSASYICPSNSFILPGHGDRSFFFFDLFWFLRWKSNFTFLKIECLISPALCELVLFKLLYYVYGGLPVCMVVHHTHAWSPGGRKWVSELL